MPQVFEYPNALNRPFSIGALVFLGIVTFFCALLSSFYRTSAFLLPLVFMVPFAWFMTRAMRLPGRDRIVVDGTKIVAINAHGVSTFEGDLKGLLRRSRSIELLHFTTSACVYQFSTGDLEVSSRLKGYRRLRAVLDEHLPP